MRPLKFSLKNEMKEENRLTVCVFPLESDVFTMKCLR